VKNLLEAGHTLHKPLAVALVQRFAEFAHGVGLDKYNEFLLPIFTFVQKCCGMSESALHQLLKTHRLEKVLFPPYLQHSRRPETPLTMMATM
jgi:hypothetical protein